MVLITPNKKKGRGEKERINRLDGEIMREIRGKVDVEGMWTSSRSCFRVKMSDSHGGKYQRLRG